MSGLVHLTLYGLIKIVFVHTIAAGECFYVYILYTICFNRVYESLKLFNPFPNKPWFLRVGMSLKTMWEKEKLLVTSSSFFFHIVFYPFGELYALVFYPFGEFYAVFIKYDIVVCKLCQFEKKSKICRLGKG